MRSLPRVIRPLHVFPPIATKQRRNVLSWASPNPSQCSISPLCKTPPRLQGPGDAAAMATLTVGEATECRGEQVITDPGMVGAW